MEQREGVWGCLECNWESKYKSRVFDHVEAKHIETAGYSCTMCGKFCPIYHHIGTNIVCKIKIAVDP